MMSAIDDRATPECPRALRLALLALTGASMLAIPACVTVEAPDEPIVINLNVSVRQEVVYRLDGDARALIAEEGEIF